MVGTLAEYVHQIDPFVFRFPEGFFIDGVRWYGLSYLAGFALAYLLIKRVTKVGVSTLRPDRVGDMVVVLALGIVAGGRLGYVLFYKIDLLWSFSESFPWWDVFAINKGGMASHGGMIGTIVAAWLFARRYRIRMAHVLDLGAFAAPPGLFFGRLANFVNGELYGRGPTDVPWAVVFPGGGEVARHPSQLYEAALEGLVLGAALLWLALRRRAFHRPGLIAGVFFAGYGAARFVVEWFRQADPQFITPDNPWGHVIGTAQIGATMGQVLSLPMVVLGLALVARALARPPRPA